MIPIIITVVAITVAAITVVAVTVVALTVVATIRHHTTTMEIETNFSMILLTAMP